MKEFGRPSNVKFDDPDFIMFAKSFGAKGYKVTSAAQLLPIIKQAISDSTVVIIDCPVDYSENLRLTKKQGEMVTTL